MKPAPVLLNLGAEFYDRATPARFPKCLLRWYNKEAAANLNLDHLTQAEIQNYFWAFQPFRNNIPYPLAMRYHGHQFGQYNSDLGDGRGFVIAEFIGRDRKLHDLGTKGSGPTMYARGGDGKLTLKGAIRELLATEMLESLGVNTSQTLCIFETGENLERQDEPSPTRSAVLTRRMHSSIRIGTFQRLAHLSEAENMQKLVGFCLDHYYPEVKVRPGQNEGLQFFRAVTRRTAELTAQLMMAGFVHGLLNTDSLNIAGEVFDYGPYRFLPYYNAYFTAAYFDHQGLYCYGRQPESLLFGLEQLGQSLKVAYPNLSTELVLKEYAQEFNQHVKKYFFRRLNLQSHFTEDDDALFKAFYKMLESGKFFFEQTFYDFQSGVDRQAWRSSPQKELYKNPEALVFLDLLKKYKVASDKWVLHPYFQNPRPETLLIQEIEAIWQAIALEDNWIPLQSKIERIRNFRGAYSA